MTMRGHPRCVMHPLTPRHIHTCAPVSRVRHTARVAPNPRFPLIPTPPPFPSPSLPPPSQLAHEQRAPHHFGLQRILKHAILPQRDVVIPPVPHGRVAHAVHHERNDRADDHAGADIVPIMRLVDGQAGGHQRGAQQRGEKRGDPVEGGLEVGPDLEFGVHPQEEEDVGGKRGRGVAGRERCHCVLEGVLVRVGAHLDRVHDLVEADGVEARGVVGAGEGDVGLADVEEVGAEAADELLDDDLEKGGEDDGVEQAEHGVVEVPEGADADLGQGDDAQRDDGVEDAREGGRDDPAAAGVGKLRVDDVA